MQLISKELLPNDELNVTIALNRKDIKNLIFELNDVGVYNRGLGYLEVLCEAINKLDQELTDLEFKI